MKPLAMWCSQAEMQRACLGAGVLGFAFGAAFASFVTFLLMP